MAKIPRTLALTALIAVLAIVPSSLGTARLSAHDPKKYGNAPGLLVPSLDGAVHPEMIPDESAYSIMFRVLARRRTTAEEQAAHAYAVAILKFPTDPGARVRETKAFPEELVNRFFDVADRYSIEVAELDQDAKAAALRLPTDASASEAIHALSLRKRDLTRGYVQQLAERVGPDYLAHVSAFVHLHMKSRIQIALSPRGR